MSRGRTSGFKTVLGRPFVNTSSVYTDLRFELACDLKDAGEIRKGVKG